MIWKRLGALATSNKNNQNNLRSHLKIPLREEAMIPSKDMNKLIYLKGEKRYFKRTDWDIDKYSQKQQNIISVAYGMEAISSAKNTLAYTDLNCSNQMINGRTYRTKEQKKIQSINN